MKRLLGQNFAILFFGVLVSAHFQGLAQVADNAAVKVKAPEQNTIKKGEIQFNYSSESLTNGYGRWRSASLDFSHRFTARQVLYGSLLATERFNRRDRQATLGIYQPLSRKWTIQLEANASLTHRTLPKWSLFGGVERNFSRGWNVQLGYRRTNYTAAKVNLTSAGVEKYFGSYRAAYTLYISNLTTGGTSASHRVQFNRYYGENSSSVGVSGGFGRELESLGANGVLQTAVQSGGVSGRHWFNRRWGVNYDASVTRQGRFYIRRGVNIGVRYRF